MTAFKLYKKELKLNKQLFELGLISDVERQIKNQRAKYLYITQKADEE